MYELIVGLFNDVSSSECKVWSGKTNEFEMIGAEEVVAYF